MVHALHEASRVLVPDGRLLDLRPLSGTYLIEIVTPEAVVAAGEVDASASAPDDAAVDRAVRQAVESGWFRPRRQTQFDFDFYWDSVAEMRSFLEAGRRMKRVRPSYADVEKLHRDENAGRPRIVPLRCRRKMMLAAYAKVA